jgi:predicted nucleic acid-binding protein
MGRFMRILFDTSTLIAALVKVHPAHARALPWLQRVTDNIDTGFVASHSLAELYSTLTTFPIQPRISAKAANELIQQNVLMVFEIISLSKQDYVTVIENLSSLGIVGGVTYDALILQAAIKGHVEQIVTFNKKDFRRIYPEFADQIVSP